ncbi:transglycosylase domain-containing protein [Polymorphum gilvum]|uniref:Penicillin-binding 1 (Peptidoglycan synthetase) transmembrane protein n=1 Tax=Polymorphum gilvum (strain LMG 25793 / CGMCC 1.9160 / SL003B-26A1) TaxID=991905 RepID=F2IV32_POLGS|nr:PBP1A family penicillin-binding protein [Polymorphum gilvum]ADZ71363.1 Penicillin-binding 1 (Peptidoglycan synthetase) transmembrane protein [Polymorphum gilvum SL003B-26A1]
MTSDLDGNNGRGAPDSRQGGQQTDPGQKRRRRWSLSASLLSADAWVDTALWRAGSGLARLLERYDGLLRRFRTRGIPRVFSELGSDACTFGLMGLIVVLTFAQPAFEATRNADWRTTDDFSVTFLDRFGKEIGRRGIVLNDTVPLEEIPDSLVKATLATEDRRFFEHFGIDIFGTARAMVENLRARTVVQGGSSITQQLAKNLFLSNDRTLERKIKEAFLALWLEANLTKREILKLYLDRAYMGGGVFGVTAAADFYFKKNVRELTLAESAMLAGLYKAPSKYAPHVNLPAARARANEVLTNMVQAGFMTEGQVIGARRNPAVAVDRSKDQAPEYFLDWAFSEVKRLARRKPALARDRIVTVRTTLDPALQRQAEQAVESVLRQFGEERRARSAALVSMVPDGAVRAMVGGRDYGESQFNRAVDALRQPGSSFKPFVYMAAFLNGYSSASVVPDAPISIGGWSPRNYSRGFAGPVTLKNALTRSINTIPVRLAQAIGRDKIVETAYAMGISHELKISKSLPLGASDVSIIDMAASYSAFANGGYKATPYAILEVKNSAGQTIYDRDREEAPPARILPADKVAEMNDILVNAVQNGTGRRAILEGVVAAGKTGTTSAYRDAWFVGYTGNFTTAVWFGNDDFTGTNRVTGGSLPAMTWQKYMAYAHEGIELTPMPGVGAGALVRTPVAGSQDGPAASQPRILNTRASEVLQSIGRALDALRPTAAAGPHASEAAAVIR